MSPRLIIAAQSGVVIGLIGLTLYQARQLAAVRQELALAAAVPVELPTNSSQRQLRLRLQQLPPINLPTRVEKMDWKSIESEDYATYVANLRAVGCPEETIRDIIVADVNKLYAQRQRTLLPPSADFEYWRPEDELAASPSGTEDQRYVALQALEKERRQLLASLLGPVAGQMELSEFTSEALQDRSFQFLPEAKRQTLAAADARRRQDLAHLDLIEDATEREAREQAIRKTYEETVASTLTPQEREQLDLRSSPLASRLRDQLRGFGASREEFENLYRLESRQLQEMEQLEASLAAAQDPQAAEKLAAVREEHEKTVAATLGPERFTAYQRSLDPDYQTLYSLTREHQVPPAAATEVWDMRHAVEEQTSRIRDNPLLTADQKIRAFQAIRAETQNAIVDVLGEPLLQEYRRQGGGWLNELTDIRNLGETDQVIVAPPLPEAEVAPNAEAGIAVPAPSSPLGRTSRFRRPR